MKNLYKSTMAITLTLLLALSVGINYLEGAGEMDKDMKMDKMKKDTMMKEDKMMMEEGKMTGMLSGIKGHKATGKVAIIKDKVGNPILSMTDIKVDKVPDGRVYLAKNGDYTKGVELGLLKKFSGTVQFPIPVNVNPDDYNSVVIWCEKFSVGIGHAFFEKGMMQ